MRKVVYRPGDVVRVVNSRFVKRVGYELHPNDLKGEMEEDPRFLRALEVLGYHTMGQGRAYRRLLGAVCFAEVAKRGFGSRERKIFYYDTVEAGRLDIGETKPDYTDRFAVVDSKYTTQTGKYFAPSGGRDYDGEYWYEAGGLESPKTHVILRTNLGDIEACNVELYKRKETNA